MNRFLLLALTAGLLSPIAANADLGEAESEITQQKTFDAWCGKVKNDCKVTFDGKRLRVNGSKGITQKQVIGTEFDAVEGFGYGTTYFWVYYKKEDGSRGTGKFLFRHMPTSTAFGNALVSFTGRPIGSSDDQLEDIKNKLN